MPWKDQTMTFTEKAREPGWRRAETSARPPAGKADQPPEAATWFRVEGAPGAGGFVLVPYPEIAGELNLGRTPWLTPAELMVARLLDHRVLLAVLRWMETTGGRLLAAPARSKGGA